MPLAVRVDDVQAVGHAEKRSLPGPILEAAVEAHVVDHAGSDREPPVGRPRQAPLQYRLHPLAIEQRLDGLPVQGCSGRRPRRQAREGGHHGGIPFRREMREASSTSSSTIWRVSRCNPVIDRNARSLFSATGVYQFTTAIEGIQGTRRAYGAWNVARMSWISRSGSPMSKPL